MNKLRKLSTDEKINVQKTIDLIREKEKENLLLIHNGKEQAFDLRDIDKEIKYKLGIADSTYSNLLRGKRTFGVTYCLRIVKQYNIDVSALCPDLSEYVQLKKTHTKNLTFPDYT